VLHTMLTNGMMAYLSLGLLWSSSDNKKSNFSVSSILKRSFLIN